MPKPKGVQSVGVPELLREIKARVRHAQTQAILSVNTHLVRLYWDVGRLISVRQSKEGWGASVIPRLARELTNELPEEKGFSERNIGRMIAFYRAYPKPLSPVPILPHAVAKLPTNSILPQPVAKLEPERESLLWAIPWGHHALILEKIDEPEVRLWYMRQTAINGWSRNVLLSMIRSHLHKRKGAAVTNFDRLLPSPQSELVAQTLRDPYIFDFLTLGTSFHERELESSLLTELQRFLIELGQGFAFVGRQIHMQVDGRDFYIDLLFYHLRLRCYVVIDLKTGEFKPEYAGKMNFYLGVVDDTLRHSDDSPSIGLVLCQDRSRVIAEYTLRGTSKPIGVSEYQLTRALPRNLQSALPTVEQIEAELRQLSPVKSKPTKRSRATPAKRLTSKRKRK